MAVQKGTRLFKIASQLNIGKDTIVEFLLSKGYSIDAKPTSMLDDEMTEIVLAKFQKEYKAAEKHRERLEQHQRSSRIANTEEDNTESSEPAATTENTAQISEEMSKISEISNSIIQQETRTDDFLTEEKYGEKVIVDEKLPIVETTLQETENKPTIADTISETKRTTEKSSARNKKHTAPAEKSEDAEPDIAHITQAQPLETPASIEADLTDIAATEAKSEAPIDANQEQQEDTTAKEDSQAGNRKRKKRRRILEIEYEAGAMPQLPGLTIVGKIDLKRQTQPNTYNDNRQGRNQNPNRDRSYSSDSNRHQHSQDNVQRSKKTLSTSQPKQDNDKKIQLGADKPFHKFAKSGSSLQSTTSSEDARPNEKKKKRKKSIREQISGEEIDKVIRETLHGMDETSSVGFRSKMRQKKKAEREEKELLRLEEKERDSSILQLTEFVTTGELANLMRVSASEIIVKCMKLGLMVSINQRLDKDTITLIADDYGFQVEFVDEQSTEMLEDEADDESSLQPRPPIVTIMGHVDHGKTSLLDYIRKANVVAGEAGGITQHIGAYRVELPNGKFVSFLDTPGHEAFTAMRARGAKVTDIVILVVAADDNVMPQTIEAISHAQAANVPIVVAINKIDRPDAHPDTIRQQLANRGLLVEEWGGTAQCVEVSAKIGKNIDALLEKVLLEAEILELKANPNRHARGTIIEAHLDKGKGILATVMVQKGTLRIGDAFIAGIHSGRVRAMYDERGNRVEEAAPSTPVQVSGFDGLPQAGDLYNVMDSDVQARSIANQRQQLAREQQFRQVRHKTLDEISQQIQQGGVKDLRLLIKGDVGGSVEALSDSLLKLSNSEVQVNILHASVGAISETDVMLASASDAIVIGFNVQPTAAARKSAEHESIDIRLYSIIYDCINEIQMALEGLLSPEIKEEITGVVEVRQTFRISKTGVIAGCYVQSGKITRNDRVRVLREGFPVFKGTLHSLKRIKEDVREVDAGYECGILLHNFNDIEIGDIIESVKTVEIKRKLS